MFAEERLNQILDILKRDGRVFVKDLSARFNVSEAMIRKDLQRLEREGKLKRTYGGAILERKKAESTSIDARLIKNMDIKLKIAEKAYEQLEDMDIIFLDISSINYLIAKLVASRDKKITIVTNMVEITSLFTKNIYTSLICIGGVYNKMLGGVVGSAAIESISKHRYDKAFIGSCGVNIYDCSISNFDLEEGNTKKAIIKASKKVYLVMENEKFFFDGSYRFANLKDADFIITEDKPEEKIIEFLEKNNIGII